MSLTGKPQLTSDALLANDGFWPALVLNEFLSNYRLPPEYADDVIKTGVTLSMIHVNNQLSAVRTVVEELPYASLEAYCAANPRPINDDDALLVQYKHAVFARAKAFLLQQFNTLNRRPVAENAAKESPETEQWWLDQSQAAIYSFFALFLPDQPVAPLSGFHVALL